MAEMDDSSTLFSHIIGDMKNMGPLWEDVLMKGSKFYAAIKQTALTADAFLDAFQKLADATTNSKGATRDIGVSFTKLVMRHKAIETKLKTYVGVIADSFLTPFQECLDEWKKNLNQMEKDHAKEYKRLKGDLKKANAETAKLKKKASKKAGKQEYADQYREAMKLSNVIFKTLEDQEKASLRKIMTEERSRVSQFFNFYRPCVEQEITLVNEIENLQSILDETTKQCSDPLQLPPISEDLIVGYKVSETWLPGSREPSTGLSPPSSPTLGQDRIIPPHQRGSLQRNYNTPSYSSSAVDPVSTPTPMWSPTSGSVSTQSSHSSLSSGEHSGGGQPPHDPINLDDLHIGSPEENNFIHDHSANGDLHENTEHPHQLNGHHVLKSRTSWSSSETSDSSGIGSYHSLNSHHNRSSNSTGHVSQYRSGSDSDIIEADYLSDVKAFPPPPAPNAINQIGFHNNVNNVRDMKYATIDRSHFKKNQYNICNFQNDYSLLKQRSNSLGENEDEEFPTYPDYKMNLPKSKMNTITGTRYSTTNNQRIPIYNVFDGQTPQQIMKNFSPTNSPCKKMVPPAPERRMSTPVGPRVAPKPSVNPYVRDRAKTTFPRSFTTDNEPEAATPGSFEAKLQAQRQLMKNRSMSVDHSNMRYRQSGTNF